MEREDYAGLAYVLCSVASVLIFSVCLVVYLSSKQINLPLVGFGLTMLLAGFVTKRFIDEPDKK
jgi:hypothetical protein